MKTILLSGLLSIAIFAANAQAIGSVKKIQAQVSAPNTAFRVSTNPNGFELQDKIENQLTLFPNPASAYFTLQFTKPVSNSTLQLIDMNGRILLTKYISGTVVKVETSGFSQGVYFYSIKNSKGESIYTGKVQLIK